MPCICGFEPASLAGLAEHTRPRPGKGGERRRAAAGLGCAATLVLALGSTLPRLPLLTCATEKGRERVGFLGAPAPGLGAEARGQRENTE